MKIEEIARIDSSSMRVRSREELETLVELPCLEACFSLYDKNVFTYWSSANKDCNIAEIGILYNFLDSKNRAYADELVAQGLAEVYESSWGLAESEEGLSINFPIGPNDSVQSISDKMIEFVSGFQLQDVLYGKRDISEAPDLVRKILGVDMPEEEIYETLEVLGFYVDRENGVIWNSEELAIKHEKFVREKEQSGVSFQ